MPIVIFSTKSVNYVNFLHSLPNRTNAQQGNSTSSFRVTVIIQSRCHVRNRCGHIQRLANDMKNTRLLIANGTGTDRPRRTLQSNTHRRPAKGKPNWQNAASGRKKRREGGRKEESEETREGQEGSTDER